VPFFSVKKENTTLPRPPIRKNRYGDRLNLLQKMETGHSNPHAHHHTLQDVAILDGGCIAWMVSARMVEMSLGDTMAGGMRGGRTRLLKSSSSSSSSSSFPVRRTLPHTNMIRRTRSWNAM
jgi:hypothetical protein